MVYTIVQLADEIRRILKTDPGVSGKQWICRTVSVAISDAEFIDRHLRDREAGVHPREVLFEDDELGFCICGHVYSGEAIGEPHDHGSSWAIYGQATGETTMTDWDIVERGEGDNPVLVEADKTYLLRPGDVHFYDVGDVHSPHRAEPVKLLRIEGANLDHIQRSNIKVKEGADRRPGG